MAFWSQYDLCCWCSEQINVQSLGDLLESDYSRYLNLPMSMVLFSENGEDRLNKIYVVSIVSQLMHNPLEVYFKAVAQLLRYLKLPISMVFYFEKLRG